MCCNSPFEVMAFQALEGTCSPLALTRRSRLAKAGIATVKPRNMRLWSHEARTGYRLEIILFGDPRFMNRREFSKAVAGAIGVAGAPAAEGRAAEETRGSARYQISVMLWTVFK